MQEDFAIDTDDRRIHSGLQWNERNRNLVQFDSAQPFFRSVGGNLCTSMDLVPPRGSDDPDSCRSLPVNFHRKKNSCHSFSCGQGHALSLTLGSRLPYNLSSSYKNKQDDGQTNFVCSNIVIARNSHTELRCPNDRQLRDDYMVCDGDMTNDSYASSISSHRSHDLASPSLVTTLQSSRYLKPLQKLLDEVVCVSDVVDPGSNTEYRKNWSAGLIVPGAGRFFKPEGRLNVHERNTRCANHDSSDKKFDSQIKIAKLVALLDELDGRYEHYFHQMGSIVSSFEMVAGTGAATSYIALTIQAMSKHFSNLRGTILAQIRASRGSKSDDLRRKYHQLSEYKSTDKNLGQNRDNLQQLGVIQAQQVWRPLRGLPENSVAVLRAWLFEHFLHPYPDENEKLVLATQTGLSKNQISNWFINARVRLWKPMIEEMYNEELAEECRDSDSST